MTKTHERTSDIVDLGCVSEADTGRRDGGDGRRQLTGSRVVRAARQGVVPIAELIVLARRGDDRAIGQIVEAARALLLFTATRELPERLTQKIGVSDLVQETALEVQLGFGGFQGKSEAELFAWMRRILRNNIADAVRHYEGTAKRQVSREQSLNDGCYGRRQEDLPARKRTPDESVMRLEDAAHVAEILDALSPVHREVLHLRYWDQCTFIEIGIRMNRSPEAARKLWYRAVGEFKTQLGHRRSRGGGKGPGGRST